jgi:ketosteroid isomerase-like protein
MADLRALTQHYLASFSARDLFALEKCFSEDATLRDWDIGEVKGRGAVLDANRKIFANTKSIEARPLAIYVDGRTAVAELEIHVDGRFSLWVTDVITFDARDRIASVRAYRGN